MRFVVLALAATLGASAPSFAVDIPQIDVTPECKAYAVRGNVDVINVMEFCIYKNSLAQEELIKVWPKAHETVLNKCGALPPHQPFFYLSVLSCVSRGERTLNKPR